MIGSEFINKQQIAASDINKYGVSDSTVLTIRNKDGRIIKLKRGAKNFDSSYYIFSVDDTTIYSAKSDIVKVFDTTLKNLRDKNIFNINTAEIINVKINREGMESIEFVKNFISEFDYEWSLAAPVKTLASWEKVNNLIDSLISLRAVDFIDNSTAAPTNKKEVIITIELKTPSGKQFFSYVISSLQSSKKNELLIQKNGGYPVYKIRSADILAKLIEKHPVFKSEKIFSAIKSDTAIQFITIKFNNKILELRNDTNKFILVNNIDTSALEKISGDVITEFIENIKSFKALRMLSDNPKDIFNYGLDKPVGQIFITINGEKRTINFSKVNDAFYAAQFSAGVIDIFETEISQNKKIPAFMNPLDIFFVGEK